MHNGRSCLTFALLSKAVVLVFPNHFHRIFVHAPNVLPAPPSSSMNHTRRLSRLLYKFLLNHSNEKLFPVLSPLRSPRCSSFFELFSWHSTYTASGKGATPGECTVFVAHLQGSSGIFRPPGVRGGFAHLDPHQFVVVLGHARTDQYQVGKVNP